MRQKLRTARIYAQNNPLFVDNVEALEKVQPKELTAPEISVKLGTTWIENEDYEQFIYELLESRRATRETIALIVAMPSRLSA